MIEDGDEETDGVLAGQKLRRAGLEVKLDRGFAEGSYAVYLEFDELAARVGFTAARRQAGQYLALLKEHLGRLPGLHLGETEDASRAAGPHRKRDLEATFLSFAVETADGNYHDGEVGKQFRLGLLRANQAWDQSQARRTEHRRHGRREEFQQRLAGLLAGEAYARLDGAARERLLEEVTDLAFPARGLER
jgi:hypothetical protein